MLAELKHGIPDCALLCVQRQARIRHAGMAHGRARWNQRVRFLQPREKIRVVRPPRRNTDGSDVQRGIFVHLIVCFTRGVLVVDKLR